MICTSASCSWNLPKARALLSKSENNYGEMEGGVLTSSNKSDERMTDLVDCFQIMSRGTYKQRIQNAKRIKQLILLISQALLSDFGS